MEDAIADALKGFEQVNQDNIKDALQELALRGVHVDRCDNTFELKFTRSGKSSYYRSLHFRRADNEIANFEPLHDHATEYLGQLSVCWRNTAGDQQRAKARYIGESSFFMIDLDGPPLPDSSFYAQCIFESPEWREGTIEDFVLQRITDRRSGIIMLHGRSKWMLGDVKTRLEALGYDSVSSSLCLLRPAYSQLIAYWFGRLWHEIYTLGNLAKLIWVIVGVIGTLAVTRLFNLAFPA